MVVYGKTFSIIVGEVTKVSEGKGAAEGKVVSLTINRKELNKEAKEEVIIPTTVSFWNNDDSSKPQMADRIRKAKVSEGSYLMVSCIIDESDTKKARGYQFWYSGIGSVKTEEEPDEKKVNVITGYIASVRENGRVFNVSIPVKVYGEEESRFYQIAFWNNEDESKPQMADRAKKILNKGDRVAIVCSEIKETEYNGKTYYNLTGFSFEKLN